MVFAVLLIWASNVAVFSQFEQMRRSRERMNKSIRTDEKERRRAEERGESVPLPKPAVMNSDVQGILTSRDFKSFAEAKSAAVDRVADGENLWLYLKFKTKLGDYVLASRNAEDPAKLTYTLFAEIGPKGDVTALNQYVLQFAKEDLALAELKINLAPGLAGRNRSMPLFLTAAAAAKPGVWTNEIRISNIATIPRAPNGHLSATPFVLDLKGGNQKYRKINADYESIILRGTTDESVLPTAGSFFDKAVRDAVLARLAADGLLPSKLYFAGDNWSEYLGSTMAMKRERKIFAVFTYTQAAKCFYGLAEAVQKYDYANGRFGQSEINLQKNLPIPCAK